MDPYNIVPFSDVDEMKSRLTTLRNATIDNHVKSFHERMSETTSGLPDLMESRKTCAPDLKRHIDTYELLS